MTDRGVQVFSNADEIDALWEPLNAAVQRVLRSGAFIMGEDVAAFEREVGEYLGVRHAIGVNSGTDAITIALRALDIGPGDEVIIPSFTFFATAEPVSLLGAVPVFADIDPATYTLSPAAVEAAITPKTRAIMPVHLYGQPADMTALIALADAHGLAVIEDTAQGFGGRWGGRRLGTLGTVGTYSFFPTKNLGGYGDGGLITTDRDDLAETMRKLRVHGGKKKYHNEMLGYNSRLDTLQAAILRVKLPHVEAWNAARRRIAARYSHALAGVSGLVVPAEAEGGEHVYHQYTVRVQGGLRDALQSALQAVGVGTMIYYPIPVHRLPVYSEAAVSLVHTEQAAGEVLSLPMYPQLSEADHTHVIESVTGAMSALRERGLAARADR
jgi:dTDP-4-amino-4,6-dideoxygalactose transaminase